MPFLPLSLVKISQCRNLKDLAPLDQQDSLLQALDILHKGRLKGHKVEKVDECIHLELYFHDEEVFPEAVVKLQETQPQGPLHFECSGCKKKEGQLCTHQWASCVLLWWAFAQDASFLRRLDPQIAYFCRDFQELYFNNKASEDKDAEALYPADLKLEAICISLDEMPTVGGLYLQEILPEAAREYRALEVPYEEDPRNSFLWDMPQVFRRPVNIESAVYWSDLKKQNQISSLVRYCFSDGVSISSRDILRHAYRNVVPRELLPTSARKAFAEPGWPLLQRSEQGFLSRDLSEIEEVMQQLLSRIAKRTPRSLVPFFLQSEVAPERAMLIEDISFEGTEEFVWDVAFTGESTLHTQAQLRPTSRHKKFTFFQSFAVDVESKSVVVFPWAREKELNKEFFVRAQAQKAPEDFTDLSLDGHDEARALLKFLRSRPLPIRIKGGSHYLETRASLLELNFSDRGVFFPERVYILPEGKTLRQKGWSIPTVLVLRTLSEGLSSLFNMDVKALISKAGKKRDWDLRLLKHLGILQYVTFEALSHHFEGKLSDARACDPAMIIPTLHERIQALLVSGEGSVLERNLPLTELCSRQALSCFENYVAKILKMAGEPHSVFSAEGELIFSGAIEREFRMIYEILQHLALSTQGACFKKARTPLLSRMWEGDISKDVLLQSGNFFFPGNGKEPLAISQVLVLLQNLKGVGLRLLLHGQSLIELSEDEFKVDFQLVSNVEQGMLNWFELNPRFFLQGQEVDGGSLKNLGGGGVLEYNGRFYLVPKTQIPSLRRLEHFWLKLQQGKGPSSAKKKWSDKVYQVPKSQTLELLALRASGYAIRGDEEWKKLCEFYDSLGTSKKLLDIPPTIHGRLKHYQHEGVQWLYDLYQLKMGALLADDMGLGKTLQALSFLEYLRTKEQLGQVLIVVPSSLVYNWESELEKFTPDLPLEIFTTKEVDRIGKKLESKQPMVVVTTYGLLMENDQFLSQYKWNVVIFDEAQNLKNITTKRTSSARMLSARFKICMTGTPMENHYGEFYSLMDLVVPGCLGRYEDFRRHYVNTEIVLVEDVQDLKLRTKPLLLRRTKKEILDQLPEKQETKVSIAFEERQKKIYRDIAMAYNEKIKETMRDSSEGEVQIQMLTALLRLRQACSDPGALPEVKYEKTPPKIEALMDSLQEIIESGESALVFTQFIQTLERAENLLRAAGIPVFTLHGGVPTKQRQKLLREFDEQGGGAVMIMTLKTGGVGLNLTKASYVFHLEPWWNPSVENQATDRAHRLGQKKAVQVFRYIMHESLEEKMELLKLRKSQKFQSLFANAESIKDIDTGSGALSKDDFDFLLGLK
ncbi:DEAD/DEAH box helicase [Bdellovibrio bacteriovorus]|uniref:DEAD/DEAH box helicase n=1 Tax=Bdellovibrio bacteriovorus TaxID=959 RepID=UPI0035A67B70